MLKEFLKDYFSFSKRERIAVVILIMLVAMLFIIPRFMPTVGRIQAIDSLQEKQFSIAPPEIEERHYKKFIEKEYPRKYLSDRYRYYASRNFTSHPYNRGQRNSFPSKTSYPVSDSKPFSIIDINKADSAGLLPLRGIGPKLSARIIAFRDKLGGFYNVEQVAETYGLPDSTFQQIRRLLTVGENEITRINLNTADLNTLKFHPYIRWQLANAIFQYRKQHGDFRDVKDLLQIEIVTPEIFKKLSPYLMIQ